MTTCPSPGVIAEQCNATPFALKSAFRHLPKLGNGKRRGGGRRRQEYAGVYCNVLQCAAVLCGMLQHTAVYRSVLLCTAAYRSVLQHTTT